MRTALIATLILAGGIAQYTLMAHAVRDLLRRPRVRGDNKVLWGLVILCVPFAGALVYGWMGPTSFRQRPNQVPRQVARLDEHRQVERFTSSQTREHYLTPTGAAKVTPIRAARSVRGQHLTASRTTTSRDRVRGSLNSPHDTRPTGS